MKRRNVKRVWARRPRCFVCNKDIVGKVCYYGKSKTTPCHKGCQKVG